MGRTEREQTNMRKAQKKQIQELLGLLEQAHEEIKGLVENNKCDKARELLGQCQESAVQVGELIEQEEGENAPTIEKMENYCEVLYEIYEELGSDMVAATSKLSKKLRKSLIRVENSVKNDIKTRLEMVFLPYKVSMWDSLESVWRAADADPDCDAYVVPIPYYDKNQDGSLGAFHYEGDLLPSDVPVTHYDEYRIESREPDAIFIHNPYDDYNRVTSVEPRFYSRELKKYTECLVYVPYFITSGSMNAGQASCMAYYFADYIIIQAEKFRKFYDPDLPGEKLLPLGSPKLDKVMRLCKNPPELPKTWKEKIAGRRVYFYNTSINEMLANTETFLRKMEYVFQCFAKCKHVCLLWRPHPLLESTFDSMRAEYKPVYEKLKRYFLENGLGIYDDTPEIEPTIALCDAYIGDARTSVTSLFGMAGKPVFVLNNDIHFGPEEDDWRGEIINDFRMDEYDEWMITQGNKLYHAAESDYHYKYCCDLSKYAAGGYYCSVFPINGKAYVCPVNAQDILVIQHEKIVKKIELEHHLEQPGAFWYAWRSGDYIFLIPNLYPAIVRLDTRNDEVCYLYEGVDIFAKEANGQRKIGGSCIWNKYLMLASPDDNQVLAIDSESMRIQRLSTMAQNHCGCVMMTATKEEIWMLPYEGTTITRWNPATGEIREYSELPDGFQCHDPMYGYESAELPFFMAVPYRNNLLLVPNQSNMFVLLDRETGEMKEWKLPFAALEERNAGYYPGYISGYFRQRTDSLGEWTYRYFHVSDRRMYDINLDTGDYREIPIVFDKAQLEGHESGFEQVSDWIGYSCMESAFNSLTDLLEDRITGQAFDRDKQIQSYQKVAANSDGTCGEKVYQFIKTKCQ